MIAPSLVAMLVQSVEDQPSPSWFSTTFTDMLVAIRSSIQLLHTYRRPRLPVIARSPRSKFQECAFSCFGEVQTLLGDSPDPHVYFWGRFPADKIIQYATSGSELECKSEYLDLGGPVHFFGAGSSGASGTASVLNALATSISAPAHADACLALIDRGRVVQDGLPEDYAGKVHHLSKLNVVMSAHADRVLFAALDRLKHNGALSRTGVVMDLIERPAPAIGLSCFQHANAVEMLDALSRVDTYLARDWADKRWAINLSMGTHCGPHNGKSPLEEGIAKIASRKGGVVVVAAGNEAGRAVHCKFNVTAHARAYRSVRLGRPMNTMDTEFLVEFWWDNSGGADLEIGAKLKTPDSAGTKFRLDKPRLGQFEFRGTNLQRAFVYATPCHGTMTCLALALRGSTSANISDIQIDFDFRSTTGASVHAWIVVSPGNEAHFIEGTAESTLTVPATIPEVVAVAAVDGTGQPLRESSLGPAIDYGHGVMGDLPTVAHLGELEWNGSIESGTSYAAPRVAADALTSLLDRSARVHREWAAPASQRIDALVDDLVGKRLRPPDSALGYGVARDRSRLSGGDTVGRCTPRVNVTPEYVEIGGVKVPRKRRPE